jgi:anti-sigma factor RsiW
MTHLTDEQFEDLLQGTAPEPAHLAECPACRDRLAEQRAVRDRLRAAMSSVHADQALAERIRRSMVAPASATQEPRRFRLSRAAWTSLAAAAIVMLALTAGVFMISAPESAQAELVRIHEANLADGRNFFTSDDPAKLAEYLKTQLGFEPATPRLDQGLNMRGCCVTHFKGQVVGSYVVGTPHHGLLSIIVVPQTPEQLRMDHQFTAGGQGFWSDTFATNHMVAVRLGDFTYCAIGEVPQDLLTQILLALDLSKKQ